MERFIFLIVALVIYNGAHAYGVDSHEEISKKTIDKPNVTDYLSGSLGFNNNETYLYIDEKGFAANIEPLSLVTAGSRREDDQSYQSRPLNHFYDPKDNSTMLLMKSAGGLPAVEWVLEPKYIPYQQYSLPDTLDYLYRALTYTNLEQRITNRSQFFYSLGHVMHMLADMGQPEHVRLDQHLYFDDPWWFWEYLVNMMAYRSTYEMFTDENRKEMMIHLFNATSQPLAYPAPEIQTAKELFDSESNSGLAEFTNGNFVSIDTNFDSSDYAQPSSTGSHSVSIDALYNLRENNPYHVNFIDGANYVPISNKTGQPLTGEMQFISSSVSGNGVGGSKHNDRAASVSIFNKEATEYNDKCTTFELATNFDHVQTTLHPYMGCRRYTLNRWNFQRAHEFLIPTIVNYGNKLLEHLFRGTLTIAPPTKDLVNNFLFDPASGGITQLPLLVANTTPEDMGTGKLVAVVTYVNSNNEVVEVITSDEIMSVTPSKTDHAFSFKFTNRALPLSIEGLTAYIQVIFRGQLGDEKDNIVVARKPLSDIVHPLTLTADMPDSGVYAAIDHSNFDTHFTSLTMKLSSSAQIDGTLFPSASYHQDNCFSYYINCNGSYNRTAESFTSASDAFSADTLNLPTTMTFAKGIPPNATDLFINFINFKTDPTQPVGIAFVDISEPTFISFINSTDYTSYKSEYKSFQEIEAILTPQSELIPRITPAATEVEMIFGTNNIVSAKIGSLPIAQYSRIAVLTDVTEFSLTRNVKRLDVTNINPTSKQEWYPATVHQDVMFADGSKYHYYSGVNKLRNVIGNINILLEYKPILPLPGKTADMSILPDAALSDQAVIIY